METPFISLICPVLNPDIMVGFYSRWSDCSVPFELIMIGPNEPTKEFPENVRFIKSRVKPVQAWAYGFHIANGSLVQLISDDLMVSSNVKILDVLYEEWTEYSRMHGYKAILSLTCSKEFYDSYSPGALPAGTNWVHNYDPNPPENEKKELDRVVSIVHRTFDHDGKDLLLPQAGLMSKKFYDEVGGPDKRFLCGQADVEMYRRMILNGGKVVFSKIQWNENKSIVSRESQYTNLHAHSRSVISITCDREKNGAPQLFSMDETILQINQGAHHYFWSN